MLENLVQNTKDDVHESLSTLQLKKHELCEVEKELIRIIDVLHDIRDTTLKEIDPAEEKQVGKGF